MKNHWQPAKRIVIKIGSALLVDASSGSIHYEWLMSLCEDVAQLWQQQKQVIIVSSGAVAIGQRHLGLQRSRAQLEEQQAAAAVGQIRLAHAYQEALSKHGITVAQILLTLGDSENRQRYLNAHHTLETLLRLKVVPVINENDTVATSELRYGDNDRLAARVAQMVAADVLVLLSDIDGLYESDPRKDPQANFIPEVHQLTPAIEAMGQGSGSDYGTGGMKTKLAAARIVMDSGCRMVICKGSHIHPLAQLKQQQPCTWFLPSISPRSARKNWLAQHLQPLGNIFIDEGAAQALSNGKSLLAVGVIGIEGKFHKGDPVRIIYQRQEIARGLCNFHAYEAKLIMGQQSSEVEKILGYRASEEMIHRDDLVVLV